MKNNCVLYLKVNEIKDIKKYIDNELKSLPIGSLSITKKVNKFQYYHVTYENSKKSTTFIPHSNIGLARNLAQKSYLLNLKKYIDKVYRKTSNLNVIYIDDKIFSFYDNLSSERKLLVTPIKLSFQQKLEMWKNEPFDKSTIHRENLRFQTKNEELVRSKSEKIVADILFDNGIPYKYEKPVRLEGMGTVYSDFSLFSPHLEKEVIWEHFGMMDDPEYCENALRKIRCYRDNGYFIGENLIVTFETTNLPLDVNEVYNYIKKYFL